MTEVSYKGGNCVVIQTKNTTVVTDPKVEGIKVSKTVAKAQAQLVTQPTYRAVGDDDQKVFDFPGEYEVGDFSITGVDAKAQLRADEVSVMYRIVSPDATFAVIGHVNPDMITEEQLEKLGVIDVLIIPVGGNGYSIDPHGAVVLTRKIGPKVVIPVHFKEDGVAYEVEQLSVELFEKELAAPVTNESALKIKQPGQLDESLQIVRLDKTA